MISKRKHIGIKNILNSLRLSLETIKISTNIDVSMTFKQAPNMDGSHTHIHNKVHAYHVANETHLYPI